MLVSAITQLFLLSILVASVPTHQSEEDGSKDHTPNCLQIDNTIATRLEELFRAAAVSNNSTIVPRGSSDTRSDLNDGLCNDIITIFARGTYGSGNIGRDVGVAFVDSLAELMPGRVIVQGVKPYPALITGYLSGGSDEGARSMASLTEKAAAQCPNAMIVWGGYSQGAQVAHKAAKVLSSEYYKRIISVVVFGDPYDGEAFPGSLSSKVKTYCNDDDPICDGLPFPFGGHLTYQTDGSTEDAGQFVAKIVAARAQGEVGSDEELSNG